MNERYIRTDLASEAGAPLTEGDAYLEGDGFVWESRTPQSGVILSTLDVTGEAGEARFGRKRGRYVTYSFPKPWLMEESEKLELQSRISHTLLQTLTSAAPGFEKLLTVGLGNREMTADAIGPLTVRELQVTRHVRQTDPELSDAVSPYELSALMPGVVGQTGIETAELILGAVRHVRPDAVLAVDALAARSVSRLACTVQISDTGLSPGSGIGNRRQALDRETLGVPVIALGVPTVVSSATLLCDALERAGVREVSPEMEQALLAGRDFFVSLKEADLAAHTLAALLSGAINGALCRQPF